MARLVSEYSGLSYPDNSWSARAHRFLRALWIIAVAGALGGIGGGGVAFTILHFTGGSPRQEVAGGAGNQQRSTVAPRAPAGPSRIAGASTTTASRASVSVAAPSGTAPHASVSVAAPTAIAPHAITRFAAVAVAPPSATAPRASVSVAAPSAVVPSASVSVPPPRAAAPPAPVTAAPPSAAAPPPSGSAAPPSATAPPATVAVAQPSAIAPPGSVAAPAPSATAAMQHADAPGLPAAPSPPSLSTDQQPRIAVPTKPAATEPDDNLDAASAAAPDDASVRPRAHVWRRPTRMNRQDRRALADARSRLRSLPYYDGPHERYDRAYEEPRRSRHPQNWASYNWGGGGYWRSGGWGGYGAWGGGAWGE